MIKNIVFDLGNVLCLYDPDYILDQFNLDYTTHEILKTNIFKSDEWIMLDAGTISEEDALKIMLSKMDQKFHNDARKVFDNWHLYLKPIKEMIPIVSHLKEKGYHIYLLSNTSTRFNVYKSQFEVFKYFDGFIASALYQMAKPDSIIYQTLLNKFDLKADECLFIDDVDVNILGAKKEGFHGYIHTTPSLFKHYLIQNHLW